jgi:hypothetical protein
VDVLPVFFSVLVATDCQDNMLKFNRSAAYGRFSSVTPKLFL